MCISVLLLECPPERRLLHIQRYVFLTGFVPDLVTQVIAAVCHPHLVLFAEEFLNNMGVVGVRGIQFVFFQQLYTVIRSAVAPERRILALVDAEIAIMGFHIGIFAASLNHQVLKHVHVDDIVFFVIHKARDLVEVYLIDILVRIEGCDEDLILIIGLSERVEVQYLAGQLVEDLVIPCTGLLVLADKRECIVGVVDQFFMIGIAFGIAVCCDADDNACIRVAAEEAVLYQPAGFDCS